MMEGHRKGENRKEDKEKKKATRSLGGDGMSWKGREKKRRQRKKKKMKKKKNGEVIIYKRKFELPVSES